MKRLSNTWKAGSQLLRELPEPDDGGFGWGYNGGGTSRAAALILADAVELGDPDGCGIGLSAYSGQGATGQRQAGTIRARVPAEVIAPNCGK
ncbi:MULTISPECIES: hypothetical protein [unclassified Streptomyces]|uniref:hypothetical protein n=1 Tax=unclassified Streptomyces TaxID=2593676 RepID=UPI003439D220